MWSNNSSNMQWGPMGFTGDSVQDWATLAKQWMQHRDMVGMPVVGSQHFPVQQQPQTHPPLQQQQQMMQQFPQHQQQLLPPPQLPMQNFNEDFMRGNVMTQQQETVNFSNMESYNSLGPMMQMNTDFQQHQQQQQSLASTVPIVPTGNTNWNIPSWAVPPPPPPENISDLSQSPTPHQDTDYFPSTDHHHAETTDSMMMMSDSPPTSLFQSNFSNTGDFHPVSTTSQALWTPTPLSNITPISTPAMTSSWLSSNTNFKDLSFLDAAKRKSLPAWIRDGLEKMEREKYRQMERQRMEEEYLKHKSMQQNIEEDDDDDDGNVKEGDDDDDDNNERKSQSDAGDDDKDESDSRPTDHKKLVVSNVDEEDEEEDEELSEEEREARLMMKMRRMLTEVLLDVTNSEVISIASLVYNKAKSKQLKAPVRSLATSSALASISMLGEEYDSDDDDDDGKMEDNITGDEVDDSDEEDYDEAMRRIQMKRKAFEEHMSLMHSQESKDEPSRLHSKSNFKSETSREDKANQLSSSNISGEQLVKENKSIHEKVEESSPSSSSSNTTSSTSSSSEDSDTKRKKRKKNKNKKSSKKEKKYFEKNIDKDVRRVKKHDSDASKCLDNMACVDQNISKSNKLKKSSINVDSSVEGDSRKQYSVKEEEFTRKISAQIKKDENIKISDETDDASSKIKNLQSKNAGVHKNRSRGHRSRSRDRRSRSRGRRSRSRGRRSRSGDRRSKSVDKSRKVRKSGERNSRSQERKSSRSSGHRRHKGNEKDCSSRKSRHSKNSRSRS